MISVYTNLLQIREQLENVQSSFCHFQLQKCSGLSLADFLVDNSDEVYILSTESYDDLICKFAKARGLLNSCIHDFFQGEETEEKQFESEVESERDENETLHSSLDEEQWPDNAETRDIIVEEISYNPEPEAQKINFIETDKITTKFKRSKSKPLSTLKKFKKDPVIVDTSAVVIEPKLPKNHRQNLKNLLTIICSFPDEKSMGSSFDVLQGKSPTFYGLSDGKNKWPKEISLLLLLSPNFEHKDNAIFFSKLFKKSVQSWKSRLAVYKAFLTGSSLYLDKQRKLCGVSTLIRELLETGFQNFDSCQDSKSKTVFENEKSTKLETSLKEEPVSMSHSTKESPSLVKLSNCNPCVVWLSQQAYGFVFKVACQNRSFAPRDLYHFKRVVISEMKAQQAIALVALAVPDNQDCQDVVDAQILVQSSESPTSDPNKEFENVYKVLEKAFGVCKQDMFKTTEVMPDNSKKKFFQKLNTKERRKIECYNETECHKMFKMWKKRADDCRKRNQHNTVAMLPCETREDGKMQLRLNSNLDQARVNNLALLMGDSPDHMTIRSLLTEDGLVKFINNEVLSSYQDRTQNYSLHQLCRAFIEIFRHFTKIQLRQMCPKLPFFESNFKAVREILSMEHTLDEELNHRTSKQCPNCGKVFNVTKNSYKMNKIQKHIKECRLERATCSCQISFKSPADRRRHMLVAHSGQTYLECPQCPFITKNQSALDNHVLYNHGVGQEVVCDLCLKSFKCKYHLQIHRFNHESHLCTVCWVEIIGRNSWNNHLKKIHGAGTTCSICSKILANQVELDHHVKIQHSLKVWSS